MQTLFGYMVVLAISAGLLTTGCGFVGNETVSSGMPVQSETSVANEGYDMTAYFALGKAVKGSPQLSLVWEGATYFFSSEENRTAFLANPSKYIPGYESYCPISLANGSKLEGKPTVFRVYEDRLFLFVNEEAALEFDREPEETLKKADGTWEEIKK